MSKTKHHKSQAGSRGENKAPPRLNKPQTTGITGISRNTLLIIAGLAVIAMAAVGYTILTPLQPPADAILNEITVKEGFQKYEQGVFLLDVRTQEEWEEFHAPNTTLIPLSELEARLDELPTDQEIVVICRSGNRSQEGRDILKAAGFGQVSSIAGGLNEWKAAGYPTVSGP
jgi:rhodanese-related sulfurtransferase